MKSYLLVLLAFGPSLSTNSTYASHFGRGEANLDTAVVVLREGSIPQEVCDQGESGVFFLYMRIGMDGKPTDVKVVATDNENLELAAIETGTTFSFRPPMEDDEPTEASVILILNIIGTSDSTVGMERCRLEYSLASGFQEIDEFDPPKLLTRFTPIYPVMAAQMGMEGRVVVEMFVDKEGMPTKLVTKKSTDKSFEDASLYAAERFKFKPAHYKGQPIGLYIRFPFRFTFKEMRGLIEHFEYGFGLR